MEIAALRELLKNTQSERAQFTSDYQQSLRYYTNKDDITNRNNGESKLKEDGKDNPLRKADNRISNNYYQLLVDQEAGYVATVPPSIDVGNDSENQKVSDVLGDEYGLTINKLVVDGANAGRGCLHYWIDEDGNFRYAVVPPEQVTPIYDTSLTGSLIGVLRSYKKLDSDTGKYFIVHEYWNDEEGQFFRQDTADQKVITPYNCIHYTDITAGYETGTGNVTHHSFGRVPFIFFPKNRYERSDLLKCKGLIDAYDSVYSGFLDDIMDVQQVILVLTNYGGTDLNTFMDQLKKYKAIKFENAGEGDKSGVDKLTIDIPVEARKTLLDLTRDNIFLEGQGVDPANFHNSNASGVAIKMLYSHLELKAANTETYYTNSLNELIRAIMNYLGFKDANSRKITQTWTRTQVEDDYTKAQTVAQVANFSSKEAIAKANPIVTDWNQELVDQKKDIQESDGFTADQKFNNDDYQDKQDDEVDKD